MRSIHCLGPGLRSVGSVPGRTPRSPASPGGAPCLRLRTGDWGVGVDRPGDRPPPQLSQADAGGGMHMAGSGPGPWSSCRPPSSPPRSMGCGAPALGDWALRPPCQTPCPDWQEHTASGAALISRWPLVAVSSAAGPWRLWAGRARGPSGSRCAHRPDSWLARGLRGPAWAVPWDKGRLPQVLRGVCLTDGAFARCSRPLAPQGPQGSRQWPLN